MRIFLFSFLLVASFNSSIAMMHGKDPADTAPKTSLKTPTKKPQPKKTPERLTKKKSTQHVHSAYCPCDDTWGSKVAQDTGTMPNQHTTEAKETNPLNRWSYSGKKDGTFGF